MLVNGNFSYSLRVSNAAGAANATDVRITDTLPNGVTLDGSLPTDCTSTGTNPVTVTCDLGTVNAGETVSRTINLTAPGTPGTLENRARVTSPNDPTPNDSNTERTTVVAEADLSINKTDNVDPVLVNSNFSYTFTVGNAADAGTATDVVVIDTLPSGVTLNGSLPTGCTSSTETDGRITVTCELGTVDAGQTVNRTINITAPGTPGTLNNTATLSSPRDRTDSSDTEQTMVVAAANLSVTKSDNPDPVPIGSSFTYTFAVTNAAGAGAATNVQVKDTLPEGVSLNGKLPDNCSSTGTGAAGDPATVTCKLPDIAGRASESVSINLRAPNTPGTLNNTATVSSDTDPGSPKTSDNQQTTVVAETDLSITKNDDPDPVLAGEDLTYTITVANPAGAGDAADVVVKDTLPANTTFESATPSRGSCNESGGTVKCSLGDLASGDTATIAIVVRPAAAAAGATITNSATVSSPSDPSDSTASQKTTVDAAANLAITKEDAPDPVLVGQDLTYTVTATNEGPSTATAVSVEDTLPASVSFKSAAPSQGSCNESGGVVTCDLGDLASGATATVEIVVQPTAVGNVENTAKVSSTTDDPDRSNNRATVSTMVRTEAKQPPRQPPAENTSAPTESVMMRPLMQNSVGCHMWRLLGEPASGCRAIEGIFAQSSGDQASSSAEGDRSPAEQEQPPAENAAAEEEQASSSEQAPGGRPSAERSSSPAEDTRAGDPAASGLLPTISGLYRPVDQLSDARRAADGPLPGTGGLSFLIPATALLLIGSGVLILAVKRRYF